ncbi:methyltransferase domain-containing protein [Curtobacterium sp. S6]|uniref:methyltransferase domain-containing protein n=1 Tax=Curtobacterium sp. S6 TaxID=1479623 RepID=UPI0004A9EB77|nr:methyltransferase domain-containing protein [Curtobacterium sp. S6]
MHCDYFSADLCRSCVRMGVPYGRQLEDKQIKVREILGDRPGLRWASPMASRESGFRNKAKMVVTGSAEDPNLGIVDRRGRGTDLSECGLYPAEITRVMPVLKEFIRDHGLVPYDISTRRGELKNIIVTVSPRGELMVRFVVRSKKYVVPIRRALPGLLGRLPHLRVVSANILREHKAVPEGPEEVPLTDEQILPMPLNGIDLHLRPHGFFQTNSDIAAAMYRQAADWAAQEGPASVWDLFCGVGGFALHLAERLGEEAEVHGIEIDPEAIEAAKSSARAAGLNHVHFSAADAGTFATMGASSPQCVVVNPPRRGIGSETARWLETAAVDTVIYSSCNAASLATDLDALPSYEPCEARLFDMFPQTTHSETMVLLRRRSGA